MNLKEHKHLVWQYERLLRELSSLREVKPDDEWLATAGDFTIPLPADYAQKLLHEHLCHVEKRAKDIAALLGITFEDRAPNA